MGNITFDVGYITDDMEQWFYDSDYVLFRVSVHGDGSPALCSQVSLLTNFDTGEPFRFDYYSFEMVSHSNGLISPRDVIRSVICIPDELSDLAMMFRLTFDY